MVKHSFRGFTAVRVHECAEPFVLFEGPHRRSIPRACGTYTDTTATRSSARVEHMQTLTTTTHCALVEFKRGRPRVHGLRAMQSLTIASFYSERLYRPRGKGGCSTKGRLAPAAGTGRSVDRKLSLRYGDTHRFRLSFLSFFFLLSRSAYGKDRPSTALCLQPLHSFLFRHAVVSFCLVLHRVEPETAISVIFSQGQLYGD